MIASGAAIDGRTYSATFRSQLGSLVVHWRLPGSPGADANDALLPAALLPAMSIGDTLTIESPVSDRLLSGVQAIQEVFETWSRHDELTRGRPRTFQHVPVHATAREPSPPVPGNGVAAFFTGGVDSFYTALKRRDELTALVFVHGFDVPLTDQALRARVGNGLRRAATELGLPLVEVETNLRGFSDQFVDWLDYHGAALASVALMLAPHFRRFYVPATMTYATLDPLGSHPLVDPLWSTDVVELVHDGCEATRLEKISAIERCDAARAWLRVCPKNWDGAYNCGRCEKCLRTMVAVRLLAPAQSFASLPELDHHAMQRVAHVKVPGNGATWMHYLQIVSERGRDRALRSALRSALRRRRARELGGAVVGALKLSSRTRRGRA